ncbi:MAG: hypothetical protein MH204_03500, partial [Fimbriimonadaceae bacterium]|nr:hypothetical protein [Fimbriimonadaceae bacterium]
LRTSDADTLLMPRFTWFVTPAAGELPSVVFGMGSDRLSIPRGQAFFLTFSRSIPGTPVSPFVSAKYATFTNRLAVPFGANVQLAPGLTFQGINDGEYTHLLLTRQLGDLGLTLLAARSRNLGIQINYGF